MSLFIGRIPREARVRDLEELFSKYGPITRCDIKKGGYGFVEYRDQRDADDAIRACDGMRFFSERLVVEMAKGSKRANEDCFRCGKPGHWAKDCALGPGDRMDNRGDRMENRGDRRGDRIDRRDDRGRNDDWDRRHDDRYRGDRLERNDHGDRYRAGGDSYRAPPRRDNRDDVPRGRGRSRSPIRHPAPRSPVANGEDDKKDSNHQSPPVRRTRSPSPMRSPSPSNRD